MNELYEVCETPGVGWAVFDPWGELLLKFDNGFDARAHAKLLNEAWPAGESQVRREA